MGATPKAPTEWQKRLMALGWEQDFFANIVGLTPVNFSIALRGKLKRGVPLWLRVLILAAETMSMDQRLEWIRRCRAMIGGSSPSPQ